MNRNFVATLRPAAVALLALLCLACNGKATAPATAAFTDADRTAILQTLGLAADTAGQVMNECGERVAPQFLPAQLGGRVGTAILFAISGGPRMATCYGDGPDIHLLMREGSGWREVYSARGRMLIILPTSTADVRDIADGGPGLSFPVWTWNGSVYVPADREVSDAELSNMNAAYLP